MLPLRYPIRPLMRPAFGWLNEMSMTMTTWCVIVAMMEPVTMKMGRRVVLPLLVDRQPTMRMRYRRQLAGE